MKTIETEHAPKAIGPYSQAVSSAGFLYTAGQVGLDPKTMELADTVEAQTEQVFQNLRAVLAAAGVGLQDVVKASVFVADIADFGRINEIYAAAFGDHKPARSLIEASALPKGALVEIDVVARLRA